MSDTEQTIKILAIESSCDETAAAVVVNGRDMRSNVISSQIALHTLYGGVVPEIASRKHIEKINQVIAQALSDADMTLQDMDAIGVTYGRAGWCTAGWRGRGQGDQLCCEHSAGRGTSYRRTYQRKLY